MRSHITSRPDNKPVRNLRTSRRCFTGQVSLATGRSATFESSLERDWLLVLDFDPDCTYILEQPFSIEYFLDSKKRRYTPDILAEFTKGEQIETVVYEVKPREELKQNWPSYKDRFKAAIKYCRSQGWRFKIVTEPQIRTSLLENARFLRRYRKLPDHPVTSEQLLYTLRAIEEDATPGGLLTAAYWHEETRMKALPFLWKLIAERRIGAFLNEPLTMNSPIWLSD